MPTNLYGPNDNFDLTSSHVLPAMIRKFHEAKVAGAKRGRRSGARGTPRREFLHVDDLADACVFLMEHYDGAQHINVGTGEDLSIRELAEIVRDVVYPDGAADASTPRSRTACRESCSTSSQLHALGWRHRIGLNDGVASTYEWFLAHQSTLRLSVAPAV